MDSLLQRIPEALATVQDPVRRRALFVALLDRELRHGGERPLLVVGGLAVEIHTAGNYTTRDIDLRGPGRTLERLLLELGFVRRGSGNFAHPELDIYVDWLGEGALPPQESVERIVTLQVAEDLYCQIIGLEDLVIDRLAAAVHWKDEDSLLWAGELLAAQREAGQHPDLEYPRQRAAAEEVLPELESLLRTLDTGEPS